MPERPSTDTNDMDTSNSLTNQLLIAMPGMLDPNFSTTVTLICEHNENGALGIIINRPLNLKLAGLFDQLAVSGADPDAALSIGSPAYASPEQLRRERVGPASDVWGLGITLFETLTGRLPFAEATTQAELLDAQLHRNVPSVRSFITALNVGYGSMTTSRSSFSIAFFISGRRVCELGA